MNWDKKDHIISGIYQGVAYAGRVRKSQQKKMGEIHHTIDLFEPIYIDDTRYDSITVDDLPILSTDRPRLSA